VTERLIDDPDGVSVLAARVSDATGIPAAHVEKDFWVTEVLRGVVAAGRARDVALVFKGGTSLSKAYGLIERFSEDVDVLVVLPGAATKGQRDSILKALVVGASEATALEAAVVPEATSKGAKRGARFAYRPSHHLGSGLSEGVFLELGSAGGAMPCEQRTVTSLIAASAANLIAGAAEAEPLEVRVLEPCRTLVEKLVLLHTAHSDADAGTAVKAARHHYDVQRLLSRAEVLERLAEIDVSILAHDVCTYSTAAERPALPRPAGGFAASCAFGGGPHMGAVRTEYEDRVLRQLLWPGAARPSFEDCLAAVHAHAPVL